MGQLHGKDLVVVDDLAEGGTLHPVQQAMVDHHASQCGFCTPGFVMSLFTLYHAGHRPARQEIVEQLAGNLCRCTGYRPIIDAAAQACTGTAADGWAARQAETAAKLAALNDGEDVFLGDGAGFTAIPASAGSLLALAAQHEDAVIVAGATDVGLWITKQMRELPRIIHVSGVPELHDISHKGALLSIGAAATYAETEAALASLAPDVTTVVNRIGSRQVRSSGTIGGNIANGSPIGDMPPMLIALGARLVLRSADAERQMPLEDFFIAYGKQDRREGELVWRIDVPALQHGEQFRAYKLSKRLDQDISAVMAAFKLRIAAGRVSAARIAFGGMAATPKRALKTEAALVGASLADEASWQPALAALQGDYHPISDMRASATYRIEAAQGLLRKALLEAGGTAEADLRIAPAGGRAA
jgi:xanthine dehydrogenase small subunit